MNQQIDTRDVDRTASTLLAAMSSPEWTHAPFGHMGRPPAAVPESRLQDWLLCNPAAGADHGRAQQLAAAAVNRLLSDGRLVQVPCEHGAGRSNFCLRCGTAWFALATGVAAE